VRGGAAEGQALLDARHVRRDGHGRAPQAVQTSAPAVGGAVWTATAAVGAAVWTTAAAVGAAVWTTAAAVGAAVAAAVGT